MTEHTCATCGHISEPSARFCPACGSRVTSVDDTSTIELPVAAGTDVDTVAKPLVAADALPLGVAALVVQRGPDAGSRFLLAGQSAFTIGRDSAADVFLDDVTVSRKHATVTASAGSWQVTDNGSLNGTYVNGKRCAQAPLVAGDVVTIGKFHFVVQIGS